MRMPSLRPATSADEPFLREMLHLAATPPGAELPAEEVLSRPRVARYAAGWMSPTDVGVVAELEDRPVGMAWVRLFHPSQQDAYEDVHMHSLAIGLLPEVRGQGLGTLLIRALLDAADQKALQGVQLTTSERNLAAIALYTAAGFHLTGQRGGVLYMQRLHP